MSATNSSQSISGSALVKQLFWASRPISWINTAYPFALGYFLLTQKIDAVFIVGTLFFLIPYNLLMYGINDVFDYESDLRNPRKGGVEGSILDKRWHKPTLFWSLALPVPFVIFLLINGNLASSAWLLFFVFTVIAYSAKHLRFKEIPFLDSLTSASHFVGPAIVGLTMANPKALAEPTTLLVIFAFTLWGMASHAFGAVQDIKADREASLSSIATWFGAANTVRFAFASYALAAVLLLFASLPVAVAALACAPYLLITAPYLNLKDQDCESANHGWRRFIWLNFFAGFIVTMLAIWFELSK